MFSLEYYSPELQDYMSIITFCKPMEVKLRKNKENYKRSLTQNGTLKGKH